MMIHDFLRASAQIRPEAPLLFHKDRRATYGQVEAASNQLARLLLDAGVERGDRVGLLYPNSTGYVIAYYAALKSGAVVVPLHTATDARSLRRLLSDCGAAGLIAASGMNERIEKAAEELPDLRWVILPERDAEASRCPAHIRAVSAALAGSLLRRTGPPRAEHRPRSRGDHLHFG